MCTYRRLEYLIGKDRQSVINKATAPHVQKLSGFPVCPHKQINQEEMQSTCTLYVPSFARIHCYNLHHNFYNDFAKASFTMHLY